MKNPDRRQIPMQFARDEKLPRVPVQMRISEVVEPEVVETEEAKRDRELREKIEEEARERHENRSA